MQRPVRALQVVAKQGPAGRTPRFSPAGAVDGGAPAGGGMSRAQDGQYECGSSR
ncbi:hypothetical protein [Streptomyces iakyrus]|uniref:hypothetical protein n=1 Tax=Streptomyces iakyrus TaxID=68219 RepID=UPI0036F7EB77